MVRNNTKNVNGLLKAKKALDSLPIGTFTARDYNALRAKGSSNIEGLLHRGIIFIDHVEEFEMEIEIPIYRRGNRERVLTNDAGEVIKSIDVYFYKRADKAVRVAINAFYNNGKPLNETIISNDAETETITARRYYYVYYPGKMENALKKEKDKLDAVVNRKYELMVEARKKYDKVLEAQCNLEAYLVTM